MKLHAREMPFRLSGSHSPVGPDTALEIARFRLQPHAERSDRELAVVHSGTRMPLDEGLRHTWRAGHVCPLAKAAQTQSREVFKIDIGNPKTSSLKYLSFLFDRTS